VRVFVGGFAGGTFGEGKFESKAHEHIGKLDGFVAAVDDASSAATSPPVAVWAHSVGTLANDYVWGVTVSTSAAGSPQVNVVGQTAGDLSAPLALHPLTGRALEHSGDAVILALDGTTGERNWLKILRSPLSGTTERDVAIGVATLHPDSSQQQTSLVVVGSSSGE
jgi:hypothetical protein